jgi:anti-sigma factor RsiW
MTAVTRKLTCRELTTFLADYVADELRADQRSLFEEHVRTCPDCLAYLRSYRETIRLAKDAYADDPVPAAIPEPLVQAILAAREQTPPKTPSRGPRRRR